MMDKLAGKVFGGKEPNDEEEEEERKARPKIPTRQILYDLCLPHIEKIFHDQNGGVYVVCNVDERKEILDIDSEEFRAFCRRLYEADYKRIQEVAAELDALQKEIEKLQEEGKNYNELISEKVALARTFKAMVKHEKVISNGELDNTKEQIRAMWYKERETRYLGKRVLWDKINNLAYYNLANSKGEIIKIWPDKDGKGWSVVSNNELLCFTRLPSDNEQVTPVQTDDLSRRSILEEMKGLNFQNRQHRLITEVYTISLFLNGIPHPVFLPNAPERSGKSTIQAKIKSLVDPREIQNTVSYEEKAASNLSKIDLDSKKQWDRALEWESNWVTYGDNLSYMPHAVMDEICSLVQGGLRLSKKKNYTDKEQSTISILRPVGFNSITNFMSVRPDANVRTFAPGLLSRDAFADTEELWEQFYTKKPETLGYIFGIISKFLHLYPLVRNEIVPMAKDGLTSFEKVGEVISRCLGNKPGEFQQAWAEYYAERLDSSIQQNTLAQLVIIYVRQSGKREFTVQPTDAYNQLKSIGNSNGYDLKDDHSFPAHQNTLTPALKRIENILRKEGIEIDTNEKEQGNRVIRFRNLNHHDNNSKGNEGVVQSGHNPSRQEPPANTGEQEVELLTCRICKAFRHCDGPTLEHHIIHTHGKKDIELLRSVDDKIQDEEMVDQLLIAFPGRYSEDLARKILQEYPASQ